MYSFNKKISAPPKFWANINKAISILIIPLHNQNANALHHKINEGCLSAKFYGLFIQRQKLISFTNLLSLMMLF